MLDFPSVGTQALRFATPASAASRTSAAPSVRGDHAAACQVAYRKLVHNQIFFQSKVRTSTQSAPTCSSTGKKSLSSCGWRRSSAGAACSSAASVARPTPAHRTCAARCVCGGAEERGSYG
jgi:hypothetical protein